MPKLFSLIPKWVLIMSRYKEFLWSWGYYVCVSIISKTVLKLEKLVWSKVNIIPFHGLLQRSTICARRKKPRNELCQSSAQNTFTHHGTVELTVYITKIQDSIDLLFVVVTKTLPLCTLVEAPNDGTIEVEIVLPILLWCFCK